MAYSPATTSARSMRAKQSMTPGKRAANSLRRACRHCTGAAPAAWLHVSLLIGCCQQKAFWRSASCCSPWLKSASPAVCAEHAAPATNARVPPDSKRRKAGPAAAPHTQSAAYRGAVPLCTPFQCWLQQGLPMHAVVGLAATGPCSVCSVSLAPTRPMPVLLSLDSHCLFTNEPVWACVDGNPRPPCRRLGLALNAPCPACAISCTHMFWGQGDEGWRWPVWDAGMAWAVPM
mmetsp:Transcript_37905/g.112229  ORF Transcript_37905/g.112229 Transcript_37905/m.112229 type:complete len:232 (+) Transcript_37905:210-905(+)